MDTSALRWFQQVADGVTVTEVSAASGISQPGVSRALDRLSAEVGTPLLQRTGRILRLTRAGAAFKRHVDVLLHALDDGLAAVEQLVDPESGAVTLGFQRSFGSWLVPRLLADFSAEHPAVRFELRQLPDADIVPALQAGDVDVVISTVRTSVAELEWRRLLVEPLRLAVPATAAVAARERVGLADVADEPFVALKRGRSLRRLVDDLCADAGFAARVVLEADDVSTVRGLVGVGVGVAVLPAPVAAGAGVAVLPLTDAGAHRDVGVAWHTGRPLLPSARMFRDDVLERRASTTVPGTAADAP